MDGFGLFSNLARFSDYFDYLGIGCLEKKDVFGDFILIGIN